jgi:putative ABC transport system permease protein
MRFWQDIRYAVRSLHRTPTVAAAAVVTFAMGIGANTAVFSVVDAVLLRPLTFADPDRLVVIHETIPPLGRVPVGAGEFEVWRENAQSFDEMALLAVAPMILTGAGDPERLDATRVSASLFPMLGINPALGRTFTRDEEVVGRDRVVLLSDQLWRGRFGADPAIVGRSITLNDELYEVAGVLPPKFLFPRLEQIFTMGIAGGRPQLWMPFAITEPERGENSFAAIARLKRGVSVHAAEAELTAIQRQIAAGIPNPPQGAGAEVVPLHDQITGASRDTLALLWAAIATVLLIACGNITNLLLVRGNARGSELAIRSALGASRLALLRHSLVDSVVLAAIGGAGGLLVALWVLPLIIRVAPASIPRLDEVVVDSRALAFAALVTVGTGLVVGLLPALRAARTNLIDGLKKSTRAGSGSRRDRVVRSLTVSAQAALTVACLGAAGLVVRSLGNVLDVERGFQSERIIAVELSLSPGRFRTRDARAAFVREALDRLQAVPGVTSVGFINKPPLRGVSMVTVLAVEGTEDAQIPLVERPQGDIRSVDAGYFRTLGIPLIEGELFDARDVSRPVAIISSAMARRAWPGQSPIGKRFRLSSQPARLFNVIGVVGDVRNMGLETNPSLAVYVPYSQVFLNDSAFVMRLAGDPAMSAAAIRAAIADIDRDVPVQSLRTLDSVVLESVAGRSFQATLLLLFGAIAVILAGVGTFGVMSNAVAERSKELGIRLALGASQGSLQRMVLGGAIRLVGAGVLAGVPLAVAAGYALRNALFGVGPQNPEILAGAAALVMVAGVVAAWLPARRAIRIDPAATLRAE